MLLFDEPLSNLDAKLRRRVREEIRELQQKLGLTSVYVTHDQGEALAVSDRIIVMRNAEIAQEGEPRELYERRSTGSSPTSSATPTWSRPRSPRSMAASRPCASAAVTRDCRDRGLRPARPCGPPPRDHPAPARAAHGRARRARCSRRPISAATSSTRCARPLGDLFVVDERVELPLSPETPVGISFTGRGVTLVARD